MTDNDHPQLPAPAGDPETAIAAGRSAAKRMGFEDEGPAGLNMVTPKELTEDQFMALIALSPRMRHALILQQFGSTNGPDGKPKAGPLFDAVSQMSDVARDGKVGTAIDTLLGQAMSLDSVFADFIIRARTAQHPEHFEMYARLALKAQAGSRATLEALARIQRGGEQTVKVVHVHAGGQAVVADTVNHGGPAGGGEGSNGKSEGQLHGTGTATTGPPLLGADEAANEMPSARDAERPVPTPRRRQPRRAKGQ